MNNATLKQLLNEYEIKRSQAILIAEKKKEDFYNKNPRLQEIDRELCSFSLSTAKSILQTNNRDLLKDLKVKRSELLNEKEEIYQQSNISEKEKSIQTSDNSVSVNKISGDVYPTEAETESTESRITQSQTEQSQIEKQAESAEMVKEADAAQTTYIVKKGDTIMSICKKYYGNTEKLNEIIAVNNIEDADKLYTLCAGERADLFMLKKPIIL